jgi:hypothetical protein
MTNPGQLPALLGAACTLPTTEQPLRAAEWHALFTESVRRVTRTKSTSLDLELGGDPAPALELAARETECCSFFSFSLHGSTLRVEVSPEHADLLSALAGLAESGIPQ